MEGGGETTSWVQRTKESGIEEAIKIVHCCIEKKYTKKERKRGRKESDCIKRGGLVKVKQDELGNPDKKKEKVI